MKKTGFTLIELSIAIVIIGLIVAGVVGGQQLVRQAKLRSAISDVNSITAAIRAFQTQYSALPGDLETGYDYFGSACGADANATPSDRDGCNGDGDGKVEARNNANSFETRLLWRHLHHAGLIKGTYTTDTDYLNAYKPGPFSGTYYSVVTIGIDSGWSHLTSGMFYNSSITSPHKGLFINLGVPWGTNHTYDLLRAKSITPKDAKSIDVKVDDGTAQTGWVLTRRGYWQSAGKCGPNRGGGASGEEATDYVLSDDTGSCRMSFKVR
jgi:prepilin-type N-terminal cleavage/methylation domain-containing protein